MMVLVTAHLLLVTYLIIKIPGAYLIIKDGGLGTALSQTQTDPLNKIYYTDKF